MNALAWCAAAALLATSLTCAAEDSTSRVRHATVVVGGVEVFYREAGPSDLPNAEVHMLDTGHFALEMHAPEIAALTRDFLERHDG